MAYFSIDHHAAAPTFEAVRRLFRRTAVTGAQADRPLTAGGTLRAICRLSDEQLDDIGIRRKARRLGADPLARPPYPAPIVAFDYFHKDG